MITGSGPGAGKSTLLAALADSLAQTAAPALVIHEDAVWGARQLGDGAVSREDALPEFQRLLHDPTMSASRTPDDVLACFRVFRDRALVSGAMWMQDWSWTDLAALWQWGKDHAAAVRFSRSLRSVAEPLSPTVLYLSVDTVIALDRAVCSRGDTWFARHVADNQVPRHHQQGSREVAGSYATRETHRLDALRAGGWDPHLIDASLGPDAVLESAMSALAQWRTLRRP
jgi:thymidylate kinase